MKNRRLPLFSLIFVLLVSISCSLVRNQTQPQSEKPTSAVYVTEITAGGTHACALLNTGKVKCWGVNSSGQLGDDTYTDHNTANEVPNLEAAIAVSAGGEHTCALLDSGEVKCWGANISGQLGDGTKNMQSTPVLVSGLSDVKLISSGSDHTCAITRDQKAVCWGKNLYGRVGDGSNTRIISTPVTVSGLTDGIIDISAGFEHTCALTINGSVKCWGHNNYGQIGDGTTVNRKLPTDVIQLNNPGTAVATSFSTSCAVEGNNTVFCWGWIGSLDDYTTPKEIDGLNKNISAVAIGPDHICGLDGDSKVKCLGENEYGQLGNGSTNATYSASTVKDLDNVTSIVANFYYSCALTNSGEVFCWGRNDSGQLGNGSNVDSTMPVQVVGLNK